VLIERLNADQTREILPDLVELLQDVVNSGGTIGFMPPVSSEEASIYWQDVMQALRGPLRVLVVARDGNTRDGGAVIGSAQLDLCGRSNGLHRAEVMKVMVHSQHRKKGIGAQLMQAIETQAKLEGRSTLVLDTREDDDGVRLYKREGYVAAGVIPEYARSADGSLHATVYMYKLLETP
jgi:acetyltransferase